MTPEQIRPIYLMVDTSGSTVRDRWVDACNSMLPRVVESLEERQSREPNLEYRMCLLTYATKASLLIGLMDVREIDALPALIPDGFSSLASAFKLLDQVIQADAAQLRSDGLVCGPSSATVVMHGLPTDSALDLLAARAEGEPSLPSPCLHAVCSAGADPLTLRGIGFHSVAFVEETNALKTLAPAVVDVLLCDDQSQ